MSDDDPYKAPASELHEARTELTPSTVAAGNGWQWIVDGWGLFRRAPALWIGMFVVMMLIYIVVGLIPFVSILLSIASPVFIGGFMTGCAALQRGEPLEFSHLFSGFSSHFGKLAVVGLIYIGAIIVVALVVGGLTVAIASGGQMGGLEALLVGLIVLALALPVAMAYWFAPALVVLNDLGSVEAMKLSFSACLRNIVPFLVYGIVGMLLAIVAAIPLGLGFLVLGPVMLAAMYTAYRDIFQVA